MSSSCRLTVLRLSFCVFLCFYYIGPVYLCYKVSYIYFVFSVFPSWLLLFGCQLSIVKQSIAWKDSSPK